MAWLANGIEATEDRKCTKTKRDVSVSSSVSIGAIVGARYLSIAQTGVAVTWSPS